MAVWNIQVPTTEYYGPLPANPRGVVARDLEPLIRELEDFRTEEIAIDSETTGVVVFKEQVLYWSLAWGNRRCTLHASVLPYFAKLFADPNKRWIFANAKFDGHMFANMGMYLRGKWWCTQVMHSLLFEEQSHRLKDMAKHLLGWRWSDFQDTFGKISKNNPPIELIRKAEYENFPLLCEYASNDAWGTLGVKNDLEVRLKQSLTHSLFRDMPPYIDTLWDLFTKIEAPYTKVLWKMERNGIRVNREYLHNVGPKVRYQIEQLERDICKHVGWMINLNSTDDKRRYFFDQRGYRPFKMTKGGKTGIRNPSTDADSIEHFADEYGDPVAKMMLEHSRLSKLESTYIIGIGEWLDAYDRIHTRYNQDTVRTGRLSSADPNLQNIVGGEKDTLKLRSAFVASPGRKLAVFDFNQLEMRLLAAAAREKDMIDIFLRGWDIHMGNASLMMNIPYDEIKAAKKIDGDVKDGKLPESALTERVRFCLAARAAAKNIGFGLNYGMGPNKLANDLGISLPEAIAKVAAYKQTYPAVSKFYEEAVRIARRTGYAFTILGRRRNLPGIASSRNDERARAERQAINVEIQGCLPASTKILTSQGYLPIGQAPDSGIVWTGTSWAPYSKLDRGEAELAELHLSNGQTLRCDVRHQVLTQSDGYTFKHFNDLREGDHICMSLALPNEFGRQYADKAHYYWMGFGLGNAWSSGGDNHRNTISFTFGDRKLKYCKEEKAAEFEKYAQSSLGVRTQKSYVSDGEISITLENASVRRHFESLGYPWGQTAHYKRVPTTVWTSTLENRKAFLLGLLDADRYFHQSNPHIHLCQRPVLEELQILFRTVGVESTIRGPYENRWRLCLVGSQCSRYLGYGRPRAMRLPMLVPRPPTMYATRTLVKKVALGARETTYTLSVDNPGHRFDSEGIISKNSAADVVKMAQIRLDQACLDQRYGFFPLLNVHDELVFEGPEETIEPAMRDIKDWMEHSFFIDLDVPLTVAAGKGDDWHHAK